jgi:hypothetical protein
VGEEKNVSARDKGVTDGDARDARLEPLAHARSGITVVDVADRLAFVICRSAAHRYEVTKDDR